MTDKGTILVVDDTLVGMRLLADTLTAAGYQVLPADSGELALAAVAARPPELILLGIRMPGMDGFEVFRRLQAREESRDIPVMFVSASGESAERVKGLKLGAVDSITKPVRREELLARVETHVELRRLRVRLERQASDLRQTNDKLQAELAERKQAEEALLASEVRYRRLFESAKDGILILDAETGMVVDANPFLLELLGYSYEAFLGKKVWELGFLKDLVASEARFVELQHKGYVRYEDMALEASDGRRIEVEFVSNVYLVNDRKVIQCNIRDISERRQAESAVRATEDRFRRAIVDAPFPIMIHAEDGEVLHVSNSWCEITGYTNEELATISDWTERAYGERKTHVRADIDALYDLDHRKSEGDYTIRTKSGDSRIWEFSSAPLGRLPEGRRLVISMALDVTERRRSEEEIRKLALMVDTAPNSITVHDFDGRHLHANQSALAMHGYSWDEFLALNLHQMDVPASEDLIARRMQELHETGEGSFEVEHFRKDGAILPLDISAKVITWDGRKVILSIGTDITERRHAEAEHERLQAQLNQAQKMEAVGRLAGGVAHDFNNLLMGIMNYVDLCRDEAAPDHPIREYLHEITHAAKRSAEITRQLLAFARKQVIAPKVLDLNDAMAGMLKLLRRLIGEDINLAWLPGANLGPVKIDPSQVDQVLANLCLNARDAIAGVGKITLETGAAIIGADHSAVHTGASPGVYVSLAVSDDGCGMDPETLAHVFEPFFSTKGLGEGTGLGLATVYGIINQNSGFIHATSEPGQGTTFKVYLPQVAVEAAATATTGEAEAPRGHGETVLLVEDEKSLRVTCSLFLEGNGYSVLKAETPGEALKTVVGHPGDIHLLLTDVVMPGMDGRQLAERIRAVKPGIKVLFMSGYTVDVIAQRGVLEENAAFLGKPFTRDELARKVREVLGT